MEIVLNGEVYRTTYFPFQLIRKNTDVSHYKLTLPLGTSEEYVIYNDVSHILEMTSILENLLREYGLEDDIMLTAKAISLKQEVRELFGLDVEDG